MSDSEPSQRTCARCGANLAADVAGDLCPQCFSLEQPDAARADAGAADFSDTNPTEAPEVVGEDTVVSDSAQPEFPILPKGWRPQVGESSTLDDVARELRQIRARLPEHPAEWRSLGSLTAAEQMLVGFKVGLGAVLAILVAAVVLLGIGLALSVLGVVDWGRILETLLGR